MLRIFVDADACPVKRETVRVADRYDLEVILVSNSSMRVPNGKRVRLVVVDDGPDAADDWIVENAGADDIVISADIPLASRCLQTGARVLGPTGRVFTEDNIGDALATRDLLAGLQPEVQQSRRGLRAGAHASFDSQHVVKTPLVQLGLGRYIAG